MLSAVELRLRLHDLVCRSGCGTARPEDLPTDMTEDARREYLAHDARQRVEHARRMAKHAAAFRKPNADRLQVLHNAVCTLGPNCPDGAAHMSDRARALVTEWETADDR